MPKHSSDPFYLDDDFKEEIEDEVYDYFHDEDSDQASAEEIEEVSVEPEGSEADAETDEWAPLYDQAGDLYQPTNHQKRGRHAKPAHAPVSVDDMADDGVDAGDVEASDSGYVADTVIDTSDIDKVDTTDTDQEPVTELELEQGDPEAAFRDEEVVPLYLQKSRRTRKILIVVIILLVILLALGIVLTWQLITLAQNTAVQQTANISSTTTVEVTSDATSVTQRKTSVPDLVSLLGLNQDQALESLQRGAQISSSTEVKEEGNPITTELRVALTSEPADARTGTPTVYLGLDREGRIIQAGYSTSTTSLGYGALSFTDAVQNERIVEKTLEEAGVPVQEGAAVLPEDKMAYSTYGSDGTTLVREECSFEGAVDINGAPHQWSAVLSYDYTSANTSGNLADTIRTIYVYVNSR